MPVAGVDYRDWVDVPISTALSSIKPDVFIVTLGINFSTFYGSETYGWTMEKKEAYFKLQISNIKKMVEQNSPNTTLIFQTIYPVIDAELIEDGSPIRNEHVKLRNSWLIEICEELNIPVLKTEDVLCDESGQLKKEYNSYHLDGVHINPDGYAAILKYVRTHAVP
jgi:lysophospholipase L1-like esterase